MLDCFPQSVGDVKTALMAYRAVVADADEVHVAKAVRRFLSGDVERNSHVFAPSSAEFAIEVRAIPERERLEASRAELEARLDADLKRLRGEDVPATAAANPLRRIPSFREKYLAGGGNAQANG